MNVVKILLVLGLGYVALNQKSEKTRNMLLVVTGLLAFCMFSVEGLMVSEGAECIETAVLGGGESVPANATTCAGVSMTGNPVADKAACEVAGAGEGSTCSYTGARSAVPADLPLLFQSCTAGKVVKTTAPSALSGGLCENSPSEDTVCASKGPCTADKCNTWSWGGDCPKAGTCGDKCETGVWWDTYCDP
jgi:hypothetical protein